MLHHVLQKVNGEFVKFCFVTYVHILLGDCRMDAI